MSNVGAASSTNCSMSPMSNHNNRLRISCIAQIEQKARAVGCQVPELCNPTFVLVQECTEETIEQLVKDCLKSYTRYLGFCSGQYGLLQNLNKNRVYLVIKKEPILYTTDSLITLAIFRGIRLALESSFFPGTSVPNKDKIKESTDTLFELSRLLENKDVRNIMRRAYFPLHAFGLFYAVNKDVVWVMQMLTEPKPVENFYVRFRLAFLIYTIYVFFQTTPKNYHYFYPLKPILYRCCAVYPFLNQESSTPQKTNIKYLRPFPNGQDVSEAHNEAVQIVYREFFPVYLLSIFRYGFHDYSASNLIQLFLQRQNNGSGSFHEFIGALIKGKAILPLEEIIEGYGPLACLDAFFQACFPIGFDMPAKFVTLDKSVTDRNPDFIGLLYNFAVNESREKEKIPLLLVKRIYEKIKYQLEERFKWSCPKLDQCIANAQNFLKQKSAYINHVWGSDAPNGKNQANLGKINVQLKDILKIIKRLDLNPSNDGKKSPYWKIVQQLMFFYPNWSKKIVEEIIPQKDIDALGDGSCAVVDIAKCSELVEIFSYIFKYSPLETENISGFLALVDRLIAINSIGLVEKMIHSLGISTIAAFVEYLFRTRNSSVLYWLLGKYSEMSKEDSLHLLMLVPFKFMLDMPKVQSWVTSKKCALNRYTPPQNEQKIKDFVKQIKPLGTFMFDLPPSHKKQFACSGFYKHNEGKSCALLQEIFFLIFAFHGKNLPEIAKKCQELLEEKQAVQYSTLFLQPPPELDGVQTRFVVNVVSQRGLKKKSGGSRSGNPHKKSGTKIARILPNGSAGCVPSTSSDKKKKARRKRGGEGLAILPPDKKANTQKKSPHGS